MCIIILFNFDLFNDRNIKNSFLSNQYSFEKVS